MLNGGHSEAVVKYIAIRRCQDRNKSGFKRAILLYAYILLRILSKHFETKSSRVLGQDRLHFSDQLLTVDPNLGLSVLFRMDEQG